MNPQSIYPHVTKEEHKVDYENPGILQLGFRACSGDENRIHVHQSPQRPGMDNPNKTDERISPMSLFWLNLPPLWRLM